MPRLIGPATWRVMGGVHVRLRLSAFAAGLLAAGLALGPLAQPASANLVFGSSAVVTLTGGGNIAQGDASTRLNGPPDSLHVQFDLPDLAATETFTMSFDVTGHDGNLDWIIWTGRTVRRTRIIGITLTDTGTGGFVTGTGSFDLVTGTLASGTFFQPNYIGSSFTYGTPTGTFDFRTFDQVTFTVEMRDDGAAGGGANRVIINAISNPEPGTLALFGLGALGLAGLVRRRRRKNARA